MAHHPFRDWLNSGWRWRLRYWWVFLPPVRDAYESGYRMAWHESRIPGNVLDERAAFNDWASRLGDKY